MMPVEAAVPGPEGTPGLAQECLLARAAQAATDATFCQDLGGVVLSWNPAAERLYGYSAAEMLGQIPIALGPTESCRELASAHERAVAGERIPGFDSWHQHKSGTLMAVAVSVVPLTDRLGRVDAVVTSVADVSARVALARELDGVRAELQRNNDALRRSNRDLEQFAYVASHDLSEPLRVMTGYVTQLERRYGGTLDERSLRYMQHIVEASARMRALIDDLLHYSGLLREPRESTPVDLGQVMAGVTSSLSASIRDVGGNVEVGPLPSVRADKKQLESLLQNLLSNAIKFRSPNRSPQVIVTATEADGWVTLRMDDNGIGIDPEYRERVFRMFQRLHVREAYPGTGIGLAMAQQIVELGGGRIWAAESPMGGARFCCTLPSVEVGGP